MRGGIIRKPQRYVTLQGRRDFLEGTYANHYTTNAEEFFFCRYSEGPSPTDFQLIKEAFSWMDLNKFIEEGDLKQQSLSCQPCRRKLSVDVPTIRELAREPRAPDRNTAPTVMFTIDSWNQQKTPLSQELDLQPMDTIDEAES